MTRWISTGSPVAATGLAIAVLLLSLQAGCNLRPGPLRTADGRVVKVLPVDAADADEVEAAGAYQDATTQYQQALKVLHEFYFRTGALDKQLWTEQEMDNLHEAQWFRITGLTEEQAAAQSVEGPNEAGLVEQAVGARRNWLDRLDRLERFYDQKGLSFKASVMRRVRDRFDPIRTYDYFLNAEIPPASIRPTEVVPEADALFERAYRLYKSGKILPAITDYRKERRALLTFRQLVDQYPTSTKVAEAAYYVGEIYKEYFDEDVRAVVWYERAWQWDPQIQRPARSQAAFLYDFRLGQKGKALALYREALKYETYDSSRIRYANQRIKELTRTD